MAESRLFNPKKHDDLPSLVSANIEANINLLSLENLIYIYESLLYKKMNEIADEPVWFALKSFGTGFIYLYYLAYKASQRHELVSNMRDNSNNQKLTTREVLTQILTSIGSEDKNSVKFRLLQHFFGFQAKDDSEAEKIVNHTIEYLKSVNDFELKPSDTTGRLFH